MVPPEMITPLTFQAMLKLSTLIAIGMGVLSIPAAVPLFHLLKHDRDGNGAKEQL